MQNKDKSKCYRKTTNNIKDEKFKKFLWLDYADKNYVATRLLYLTRFYDQSPILAHRTLELYLKAFLLSNGMEIKKGNPSWGHVLHKLGEVSIQFCNDFNNSDVTRRLKFFERYFKHTRYPGWESFPDDGSAIWYSFDSNIEPLDELVAFIRPRIKLSTKLWQMSFVHELITEKLKLSPYQRKALIDANMFLKQIDCKKTNRTKVKFNKQLECDKPWC